MKVDFHPDLSSHVQGFDYDAKTRLLTVSFKGGKSYSHSGVPQEAVDNFAKYRSPGEFYHGVVKNYPISKNKETTNGS